MKWVGLLTVVALAAGIIVYKGATRAEPAAQAEHATQKTPRVLLFADLGEADDSCGCGQIIRAVRAAAARGVPTRENDEALGREHHATVRPSVILLDANGKETGRFEGEGDATIPALEKALEALPADRT